MLLEFLRGYPKIWNGDPDVTCALCMYICRRLTWGIVSSSVGVPPVYIRFSSKSAPWEGGGILSVTDCRDEGRLKTVFFSRSAAEVLGQCPDADDVEDSTAVSNSTSA